MTSTCSLAAAAWKAFALWLQKTTRRWGGVVSYDVTYKRAPSRSHGMLPAAHGSHLHSSLPDSAPTLQHPVRLQPFMRTLAAVSGSCCGRVRLRSQTPHGTAAAAPPPWPSGPRVCAWLRPPRRRRRRARRRPSASSKGRRRHSSFGGRAASRRGAPRPCAPGPKLRGTTAAPRAAAHFRRKHVHAIANSALLDLARRRGEALQDTFAILLDILEHAQV
jgi:hypothetical protein